MSGVAIFTRSPCDCCSYSQHNSQRPLTTTILPIPLVNIQFTQNININTFYKQDTFKNIVFPIIQDKWCLNILYLQIWLRDKISHKKTNILCWPVLVSPAPALFDQILISSNSNLWKHNKSSRYFPFSSSHTTNTTLPSKTHHSRMRTNLNISV